MNDEAMHNETPRTSTSLDAPAVEENDVAGVIPGIPPVVANPEQPTTLGGDSTNPALVGLRRAFLRQTQQIRSYRARQARELDAVVDD